MDTYTNISVARQYINNPHYTAQRSAKQHRSPVNCEYCDDCFFAAIILMVVVCDFVICNFLKLVLVEDYGVPPPPRRGWGDLPTLFSPTQACPPPRHEPEVFRRMTPAFGGGGPHGDAFER